MIYNHSINDYYYDSDTGFELFEEIKNYSKFVI